VPTAALFPNLVEYHVTSMVRYATELKRALDEIQEPDWRFKSVECHHVGIAAKLMPGEAGRQMASRLGRMVKYPLVAANTRADVYHVLDHSHANLVSKFPGDRTVITCHDLIPLLAMRGEIDIPVEPMWSKTFPYRVQCIERCAMVLAISESTKRDLLRLTKLTAERVEVVYYGVNPNFGPAASREERAAERRRLLAGMGVPDSDRVVMHVSTGGPYKNTKALLHALRALNCDQTRDGKTWLVRVGSEMSEEEQRLAASLGVASAIKSVGRITSDTLLAQYYRAADVFAFPSIWEGFGWPPLEAMACGTPAVTSNVASLPEVVADGGRTVDPHDYDGLARSIREIMDDAGLRDTLSERSLRHARRFTWQTAARRTLEVYKAVDARAQESLTRR